MSEGLVSFRYDSGKPGSHLLILGAIHGNEACGPQALGRLKSKLDNGLALDAGTLTIVPVCNVPAFQKGIRQIDDRNLNRMIREYADPRSAEEVTANALTRLIRDCDVLLDLHSCTAPSGPFLTLDYPSPESIALATAVGIKTWITGWPEIIAKAGSGDEPDTVAYAASQGKMGITVECGQHYDPNAVMAAYSVSRRALGSLGIAKDDAPLPKTDAKVLHIDDIMYKRREGTLAIEAKNLTPLSKGQVVFNYSDGTTETAQRDCYLVMPIAQAGPGDHFAFVAVDRQLSKPNLASTLSPNGRSQTSQGPAVSL